MPSRKLATVSILAALAIVLSILENITGINFGFPGVKIGLANIAVLFTLMLLGGKYALFISCVKACSTFLMSGSVTVLWFSLAGGICSTLTMMLLYKNKYLSLAGVSAAAGAVHNLTQVCVMMLITSTGAFVYYIPILTISGVICGFVVGVATTAVLKKFPISVVQKIRN